LLREGLEAFMNSSEKTLATLRQELQFLDAKGYRREVGARQPLFCMESEPDWRQPVFFEDSPVCPKERYEMCTLDRDCVLMDMVPYKDKLQKVPCRHIPLNDRGETVASLAQSGATRDQIESTLRKWLVNTIDRIEESNLAQP